MAISGILSSQNHYNQRASGLWPTSFYVFQVVATQKAIFGFGQSGSSIVSITNLLSNTGVIAGDVSGVGTARRDLAAAGYGSDKAIFGYGTSTGGEAGSVSITNLVSNTGVVATDTTGVGSVRYELAAAGYGTDKAMFGYGYRSFQPNNGFYSEINLISNTGVVATDVSSVGTRRGGLAAAGYGTDKAIFGYGVAAYLGDTTITNLVSNTGVFATDVTSAGTPRRYLAAAGYGTDKAIFGYGGGNGGPFSVTNLVSNTGVVATDTAGVGTTRERLSAANYGTDKAIFVFGEKAASPYYTNITSLVSNTGVVASENSGIGTTRNALAGAGYSST